VVEQRRDQRRDRHDRFEERRRHDRPFDGRGSGPTWRWN
jgi:hypothetical protein